MKCAKVHLLALGCVCLAFATTSGAQSGLPSAASATTPQTGASITVNQILDRAVAAGGGKETWMRITSLHLKGSVELSGTTATGTFEKFDKAPNKSFERIDFGPAGLALRGFDGTNGWKADPGHNADDLQGDELADARLDADFYGAIKLEVLYPKLVLQGEQIADGHNCYAISATPEHGTPRTFYFAKDSGLWIGMSQLAMRDGKTSRVDTYFEDFREVKGIQFPYTLRMKTEAMTITIRIGAVETNLVIMDAGFSKPASRPSAGSPANSSQPSTGAVSGNTYTDRTFGFSYTYPAGWTVHGDATNKEIMSVGRRYMGNQGAAGDAATEWSIQRSSILLNVFLYPFGTPGVQNENILVMAERVDFAPGIRTGQDYLLTLKAAYKRVAVHYTFGDDITEYSLGGREFFRLDTELHAAGNVVYQSIVSTKLAAHVISFMFSGTNKQDVEGLVGTINSVRFN